MIDILSQLTITIFGASAIWLVGRRTQRVRRWGFVCGLISQPAWYLTMAHNGQWLLLPVFAFYTYSWLDGFWNNWVRPQVEEASKA